jgi:hypothetical protein
MLRQHDHVEATRGIIRNNIINGGQLTGKNPYGLRGIEGVGKYLKDYSTLPHSSSLAARKCKLV